MNRYRISSLLNLRKVLNPENIKRTMYEYLLNEGEALMKKAYNARDWQNRTYNLHDSYVTAVFENGKCMGYRTLDPQATVRTGWYGDKSGNSSYGTTKTSDFNLSGHEEAENFVMSYESSHGNAKGITLIVAAVMFYAEILEKGQGRLRRKYQVISTIDADLDKLKARGLRINLKSYMGAPWEAIRVPENIIRRNDIDEGGRTFKGW